MEYYRKEARGEIKITDPSRGAVKSVDGKVARSNMQIQGDRNSPGYKTYIGSARAGPRRSVTKVTDEETTREDRNAVVSNKLTPRGARGSCRRGL